MCPKGPWLWIRPPWCWRNCPHQSQRSTLSRFPLWDTVLEEVTLGQSTPTLPTKEKIQSRSEFSQEVAFVQICLVLFIDRLSCVLGWPQTCYLAKSDFEHFTLLSPYLLGDRFMCMHHHVWFMWCWGLNPGLLACWSSPLPTELHPYPPVIQFIISQMANV